MQTDSSFTIGYTHLRNGVPCQDYAAAAVLQDTAAYAIVADGCSSGDNTDIGSRALTRATIQAIKEYCQAADASLDRITAKLTAAEKIDLRSRAGAAAAQYALGCTAADMLSTRGYAMMTPDGGFVHLYGDGVIAWQTGNLLHMLRYDWKGGLPFYPAYREDKDLYEAFIRAHRGGSDDTDPERIEHQVSVEDLDGEPVFEDTCYLRLSEGTKGFFHDLSSSTRVVAVFTDGVTQVEGMDWKDVVRQLLAFKTTPGTFVTRRLNRFMADARKAGGKGPLDDLAYAVILNPAASNTEGGA